MLEAPKGGSDKSQKTQGLSYELPQLHEDVIHVDPSMLDRGSGFRNASSLLRETLEEGSILAWKRR